MSTWWCSDGAVTAASRDCWSAEPWIACSEPAGVRSSSSRRRCKQPYRRVLVPIDFTASSDAAIRVAARMRREAGMHVFHAINSQREAVLRDADVPEHIIRETRLMEEAGINARMRRKVARLGLDSTPMSFALAYGPAGALDPASRPKARRRPHRRRETGSFDLGRVPSRQRQQPRPVRGDVRHVDRAAASGQYSATALRKRSRLD